MYLLMHENDPDYNPCIDYYNFNTKIHMYNFYKDEDPGFEVNAWMGNENISFIQVFDINKGINIMSFYFNKEELLNKIEEIIK